MRKSLRTVTRYERRKKAWSPEIVAKLTELYIDRNMTVAQVGQSLGYTKASTSSMLCILGITKKNNPNVGKAKQELKRKYDVKECRRLDPMISCRKCLARRECMGE